MLNFQPGSSELGEGVILMGFLEVGTCGGSTPLLLLVGVLVFCVPIPTSHYSVQQLISDGLFFSNNIRCPFDDSTVGWTLQRRRRRIQRFRLHPTLLPQLTGPFPRSSSAWHLGV